MRNRVHPVDGEDRGRQVLHFPHVAEVPLARPPLVEVICQVRFPSILSITASPPAAFQERVRGRFPDLVIERGVRIEIPGVAAAVTPHVSGEAALYRFRSTDAATSITLATDFYAVSTSAYTGWKAFAQTVALASSAVQDVYSPAYTSRIGLRYVNHLTTENTGCHTLSELAEIPRGEISTLLNCSAWDLPERMITELVLDDGDGKLKFRIGFIIEEVESILLLDYDFFTEQRLGFHEIPQQLEAFHDRIYAAFRWTIEDEQLQRFGPVERAGNGAT